MSGNPTFETYTGKACTRHGSHIRHSKSGAWIICDQEADHWRKAQARARKEGPTASQREPRIR